MKYSKQNEKWKEDYSKKIDCWCKCHIDIENVFSFVDGVHCDNCYDKRVYNWDRYKK